MTSERTEFYFRPDLHPQAFVDRCWPYVAICTETVLPSGVFYGSGKSKKAALAKPKTLLTQDDFAAEANAWAKRFETKLVHTENFWSPEAEGFDLLFRRTKPPARVTASVIVERHGAALEDARCDLFLRRCLDGTGMYDLAVQHQSRPDGTIGLTFWRDGVVTSKETGAWAELDPVYAEHLAAV